MEQSIDSIDDVRRLGDVLAALGLLLGAAGDVPLSSARLDLMLGDDDDGEMP